MRLRPSLHLLSLVLFCPLLSPAGGCSTAHAPAKWVRSQGGLLSGDAQPRAQQIADRLAADRPALHVDVSVLDTSGMSAFSWPDRRVFITRGLVERVDDGELAAAIAHELGHLIDDHHVGPSALVGLRGCGRGLIDAEARADELGSQILESKGMSRSAMARLLAKVSAASSPGDARNAIEHRLALLNGAGVRTPASPPNP